MSNTADGIRLNKFISDTGYCSRREADRLIQENRVLFNGVKPKVGTQYRPGDKVFVDGKLLKGRANPDSQFDREYIAYNKPINITSTTERNVAGNIIDAIGYNKRIFPIGRLDKMSEGLIFLTSDGDIVNKILRAENAHDKEYIVTVNKPITPSFITKMSQGVPILGTKTKPCKVTMQNKNVFKIVLTEGLNRQIRRMAEHFGYEVTKLKRVRIMNVSLGALKPGEWRKLTDEEMNDINQAVAGSSKESAKAKTNQKNNTKTANSVQNTTNSVKHKKTNTNTKTKSSRDNSAHTKSNGKTTAKNKAKSKTKGSNQPSYLTTSRGPAKPKSGSRPNRSKRK